MSMKVVQNSVYLTYQCVYLCDCMWQYGPMWEHEDGISVRTGTEVILWSK